MISWWGRRGPLGPQGEKLAARFLRRSGHRILGRNVHLGRYEIDIIAQDGDTIAFVEVKTRRDDGFLPPEENVTPQKQLHIRRAAQAYIAKHDDPDAYYRFDVVSVVLPETGKPVIRHYRNAFEDQWPPPRSFTACR